jgi:hypothetical protein
LTAHISATAYFLNWNQLVEDRPWLQTQKEARLNVVSSNPTTWYSLEEVFRRSNNLRGQNEALYQRRLLSRKLRETVVENSFSNYLSWLFWRYGVRPLRLMSWMAIVFLLFTWLYWTQSPNKGFRRVKTAIEFSIRNSWKFNYGYERSRTPPFKVATLTHSFSSKILALLLLQVFANISPLLNSVLGKLLPK